MLLLPLLVVSALLPLSKATKYNVELADRYRKYAACLRRREEASRDDEALHVQPVEVVRGSDVILPCFTCVAPEDGLEIESVYKPSSGSIGRAFKKVVDFFRQKLLGVTAVDKYKWTYEWEYARPGRGWTNLTDVHSKKNIVERIAGKVKRFLKRDASKWTLGDQYELRLRNVDRNNSGYYRCINKKIEGANSSVARIAGMFFVDVKTRVRHEMIESGLEQIPKDVRAMFPNRTVKSLEIGPRAGLWSSCSQCGSQRGEQLRAIECTVSSAERHLSRLPNESSWLKLLGHVPCSSSLVPLGLRRKLGNGKRVIQYRPCNRACHEDSTEERVIKSTDELGETRIMDYLPKGEFLFDEILPKLLPPVIRRGYLVTEGDALVLTCDVDPAEGLGVHWHSKTELEMTVEKILDKFEGRAWLDEHSRIIFDRVELTDQNMYYCYSSERILLGIHNVMVKENDHTVELVSRFQMGFKFITIALIFVVVIRKLME